MTSARRYCLDTSSLITAKDGEYGFEVAPKFWPLIEKNIRAGVIYSPASVYREWMEGNDHLKEWVRSLGKKGLKVEPTNGVQRNLRKIAAYVQDNYADHQAATFLAKADPWVIAQAWEDSTAIVTHEVAAHGSKKVKIPDVCRALCRAVRCKKTWEMVKELGGLP